MNAPLSIDVDVCKDRLDVAFGTQGEVAQFKHTRAGICKMLRELQCLEIGVVVIEATGGREGSLAEALYAAEVPVTVVNPRQIRDYAKALGYLACTFTEGALSVRNRTAYATPFSARTKSGRRPGATVFWPASF